MIPTLQLGQFGRTFEQEVVSGDPYWTNVVLLLDASTFADGTTPSNVDVTGKTATWVNNAVIKTDNSVFGGEASMYFDGTDDRVSFADSADFAPGTGDYTVEMWAYAHASSGTGDRILIGQSNVYNGFYPFSMRKSDTTSQMAFTDGISIFGGYTGHTNAVVGKWQHYALVRFGGQIYGYIDGVRKVINTSVGGTSLLDSTGALAVGAYSDFDAVGSDWYGWIDQVRITKGVSRYRGGFITVPSAKFPHS